jgi:hypothetical protein
MDVTPVVTWLDDVTFEDALVEIDGDTLHEAMNITNIIDKIDLNIFIIKHLKIIILQRKIK